MLEGTVFVSVSFLSLPLFLAVTCVRLLEGCEQTLWVRMLWEKKLSRNVALFHSQRPTFPES